MAQAQLHLCGPRNLMQSHPERCTAYVWSVSAALLEQRLRGIPSILGKKRVVLSFAPLRPDADEAYTRCCSSLDRTWHALLAFADPEGFKGAR